MAGRRYEGEVTHERCHANVFLLSLFLLRLTFAPRTKTSNRPQARGRGKREKKKGEKKRPPKKRKPHTPAEGPAAAVDAKPSTQSPHMLLWPAVKPWSGSNLQLQPPATPAGPSLAAPRPLPPAFLCVSPCVPVIYSPNDKTQTSAHSQPLPSEDNHVMADDSDTNQTPSRAACSREKGTGGGRGASDVDLHKWSQRRKRSGARRQMERFLGPLGFYLPCSVS